MAEGILEHEDERNCATAQILFGAISAVVIILTVRLTGPVLFPVFGVDSISSLMEKLSSALSLALVTVILGMFEWCLMTVMVINRDRKWGNGWVGGRHYLDAAIEKLKGNIAKRVADSFANF